MLYKDEFVINAANIADHLGNATDRLCGTKPRTCAVGSMAFAPATPFKLIPRDEWPDRISQMEREKSRLSDFILYAGIPCFDQQQTNYCHANSPALAIMALRAVQGSPLVLLSPASVAGPITNYQNVGAYIEDDLKQITEVGCASQEFVPPNQIGAAGFKRGWKEDAAKHRVTEWWDLGARDGLMFDRMMTMLLSRFPVCVAYNWQGHAVTACDPVMLGRGKFGVRPRNSWGDSYGSHGFYVLDEQYGTPDAAYVPRSVTVSA